MQFALAALFTDSLRRLPEPVQQEASALAGKILSNPKSKSLSWERSNETVDPGLWFCPFGNGYRLVAHIQAESVVVLFVGSTREALDFARTRQIGAHVTEGTLQITPAPPAVIPAAYVDPLEASKLTQALANPWDRWVIFLHPDQLSRVKGRYEGPAKVNGVAGTGKTVVALHRAAELTRLSPGSKILLTTFSKTLADDLDVRLNKLLGAESDRRASITVRHLHAIAFDICRGANEPFTPVTEAHLEAAFDKALAQVGQGTLDLASVQSTSRETYLAEWNAIIDPAGITAWEAYRTFPRTGRGTRLTEKQRLEYWDVFAAVLAELETQKLRTWNQLCRRATALLTESGRPPFDHVVADECQDFGPAELAFIRALAHVGRDDLFLTEDPGQRIYSKARHASLSSVGIDITGRSWALTRVYRTTEPIRQFTERIQPHEALERNHETATREGRAELDGPPPELRGFKSWEAENAAIAEWIEARLADNWDATEIAVFVKTEKLLQGFEEELKGRGIPFRFLREERGAGRHAVAIGSMHGAKGLEYRGVVVMRCNADVLPSEPRQAALALDPDLQLAQQDEERHLLYVACTRARERLLVTYTREPSVFLADVGVE